MNERKELRITLNHIHSDYTYHHLDDSTILIEPEREETNHELVLEKVSSIFQTKTTINTVQAAKILGLLIGALSSYEYYELGSEFSHDIIPNGALAIVGSIFFGTLSLGPNSAINLVVNREIFEELVTLQPHYETYQEKLLVIIKTLILLHSTLTSFTFAMLLLKKLLDSKFDLSWIIILISTNFISNIFIFYYCEEEFLEKIFHLTQKIFDNKAEIKRDMLRYCIDQESQLQSPKYDTHFALWKASECRISGLVIKSILANLQQYPASLPGNSIYYQGTLGIIGSFIGVFSITSYFNVGPVAIKTLGALFDYPGIQNNQQLALFFSTLIFISFLAFSLDQTADALDFLIKKLQSMENSQYKFFLFTLCLSLGASIPNIAVAIKYSSGPAYYKYLTVFCSTIAPALVSNKWFYEFLSSINIEQITPSLYLKIQCKLALILSSYIWTIDASYFEALNRKIITQINIEDKARFTQQLQRVRNYITFMPIQQVQSLMMFKSKIKCISKMEQEGFLLSDESIDTDHSVIQTTY